MPSVGSESSAIQHARHQQPSNRSRNETADREPASPFAEMLDSATPPSEPPPASHKPRAARADMGRPTENHRKTDRVSKQDDAKPGNDAQEAKDAGAKEEVPAGNETEKLTPPNGKAVAGDSKDLSDTDDKAQAALDAGFAAALDALVGDGAPPEAAVTVTLPVTDTGAASCGVAAFGEEPAAAVSAALQVAAEAAASSGAPPAVDGQVGEATDAAAKGKKGESKGEAKPLAQANAELAADAKTITVQKDGSDQDGAKNNDGQTPDHAVRHAAGRPDPETTDAKPRENHGGEVSAVAKQNAPNAQSAIAASTSANADAAAAAAPAQASGLAVAAAHAQPAALASTPLPAHIQAQLQASTNGSPAIPLSGVAVEIASQAFAGKSRFEIRLDPPELGRIDVKLDIDGDGNTTTRLVVERTDTLDLLKRDASQLERALQQAGLKTSDHGLEFSLRQETFAQNEDQGTSNGAQIVLPDEDTPIHAQRQNYGRLLGMGSGLDIRV